MFPWSKEARILNLECKIAGKKARLAATIGISERAKTTPGGLVIDMVTLPQEIAELEHRLSVMKKGAKVHRPHDG